MADNDNSSQNSREKSSLNRTKPFIPGYVYTAELVADHLDVSLKWVKHNMLEPTDGSVPCRHFRRGNCILIRAEWIQDWIDQAFAEA